MAPPNSHRPSLPQNSEKLLLPSSSNSSLSNIPSKLIRSFSSKLRSRCHKPHVCTGEESSSPLQADEARHGFYDHTTSDEYVHDFQSSGCFGNILQRQTSARKNERRDDPSVSIKKDEEMDNAPICTEVNRRELDRMHDISHHAEEMQISQDEVSSRCKKCGFFMSEVRHKCQSCGIYTSEDASRCHNGDCFVNKTSSRCKKDGVLVNEVGIRYHNCGCLVKEVAPVKEESSGCNNCGDLVNQVPPSECCTCGGFPNEVSSFLCHNCRCIVNEIPPAGYHHCGGFVNKVPPSGCCNGSGFLNTIPPSRCHNCSFFVNEATSGCQECHIFVSKVPSRCQKCSYVLKEISSGYQKSGFVVNEGIFECRKCGYLAYEIPSTYHKCDCFANEVPRRCQKCGVFVNDIIISSHSIRRRMVELAWSDEQRKCLPKDAQEEVIDFDRNRGNIENLVGLKGRKQCGCFRNDIVDRVKNGEMEKSHSEEERSHIYSQMQGLPDDVIEMCLARASFSTLARARMVCRKWRDLTMSSHLLATREKLRSKKPWLFLFGFSRGGVSNGEIHALDTSVNEWHSTQANMLNGRFLFSVVSLDNLVYILGGCSNLPDGDDKHEKNNIKTHRGVLAYSPFTSSWKKCCSMGIARAMPIASVFEVRDGEIVSSSLKLESLQWEDTVEGLECHSKCLKQEVENDSGTLSIEIRGGKSHGQDTSEMLQIKSYGLIVVGGQGIWKQPLFSAEIYDSISDTWREIAKLPVDHGVTCAGVVCNGVFYAYSETDKLAAYDFKLNSWSSIQISNTITRLHEYVPKLVSCKGKLILLAVAWGSREQQRCNNISQTNDVEAATRMLWEYNSTLQSWILVQKHPDAPLDWNAVSVAEGNKIYGVEMFKIFGQVLDFVTVCDFSSSGGTWKRMSRMRLGNDLDVTSCFTKTAVIVQL